MRGKKAKLIRKYVKISKSRDDRIIPNIKGVIVKNNPVKAMKMVYKDFTKNERRKFSILVGQLGK